MKELIKLFGAGVLFLAFHSEASSSLSGVLDSNTVEQVEKWQSEQLALSEERKQRALACRIELQLQRPPIHCFSLSDDDWMRVASPLRMTRRQLDGLCSKYSKNVTTIEDVPKLETVLNISSGCSRAIQERRVDLEYATSSGS